MTALGKLFRTTTFKLTLVYLTIFALFAAFLLGYFALNTRRLIPPCRYCSERPVISALTVSVICSVISLRVLSAK